MVFLPLALTNQGQAVCYPGLTIIIKVNKIVTITIVIVVLSRSHHHCHSQQDRHKSPLSFLCYPGLTRTIMNTHDRLNHHCHDLFQYDQPASVCRANNRTRLLGSPTDCSIQFTVSDLSYIGIAFISIISIISIITIINISIIVADSAI